MASALQYDKNNSQRVDLKLTQEAPLQININNKPFTVTMRTPQNDLEMVRGLLYAEKVFQHQNDQFDYSVVKKSEGVVTSVNIDIKKDLLGEGFHSDRTFLSVSSCGICGKKELHDLECTEQKALQTDTLISAIEIPNMFEIMKSHQAIFEQTGGCHAAALFDKNRTHLGTFEDIGRHNAVDKTIGNLLLHDRLSEAEFLLVSGRVSYEIVVKAYRAGLPFLFAVSAPSDLAVELAENLGITLLGFCRGERFTVYSNEFRVTDALA